MEFDEEEPRRDDEVYDALERELVRVPDDARDAVASFLQDLRRDGVDWHSIGDGEADDERRVFPGYAAPCTRATRILGSVCMKFAHEHGAPWDQWTCEYAAGFGNLQSLQYAHEHGCPWDVSTCEAAAEYGHLDCLKYAHEHGCPWDELTCIAAAVNGQLDCLRYARKNGCPWDEKTCEGAAKYGHLECLKYAREQGCRWSKWTCYKAAENGHLECLKYAHEHGCPWDYWTCDKAAEKGHLECLKYACAHGFPGSDPYATALNEVCIPDADKRLGVEVALMFHRANGGDISMREFLPVWKEHGELYREAHLRVARELAPTL